MKTIKITTKTIKIIIKTTMKRAKRLTIIYVNYIFLHMSIKIFYTLLNAQNVTHIIIKDNNNENDDLKKKRKRIYYIKIIFAKTSIAFTLTRINK